MWRGDSGEMERTNCGKMVGWEWVCALIVMVVVGVMVRVAVTSRRSVRARTVRSATVRLG